MESREFTFTVKLDTADGETVGVVGNCPELGNWYPKNALCLKKISEGMDGEVWSNSVFITNDVVKYRYFVCVMLESQSERCHLDMIVRRWETHFRPRILGVNGQTTTMVEQFGLNGTLWKVESGWLTVESVIQLKFYNNPVQIWKPQYANKLFYIKVTPVDLEKKDDDDDNSNENGPVTATWPLIEIAVMNEHECEFRIQTQIGHVYLPDDFIVYKAQMLRPETIAFMVDFYLYDPVTVANGPPPKHVGFCYILPSVLRNTFGTSFVPITGRKQQPIGQLTVEYLVIRPMRYDCDMQISYSKYWNRGRRPLEVGHRGAGNSYTSPPKHCATVRENTIASLKLAAEHGADYVEFDVQLSKDFVPVLYHDFHVCISMKKKRNQKDHDLLEIPLKDLTLNQLQMLKVFHVSEKNHLNNSLNGLKEHPEEEEEPDDVASFPTLERTLIEIPMHVGFNIEIKWTMQRKDGTFELENPTEMNLYLDTVLKVLMQHAGSRRVIISCFHPDICNMVRLKQNRYPILFLSQGQTDKWPPYLDTRTISIPMATYFARSAGILGIDVHTEEILKDHGLVCMVKECDLVMFCWGDDNNDPEVMTLLRTLGLDGIIFDRIDEHNQKTVENIFLMETKTRKTFMDGEDSNSSNSGSSPGSTIMSDMVESRNTS
uniref:GP-PDE domain-containing protein n=1 Tax=Strigamia maritima TaxID=126957 RepID=T1J784_STRMM